MKASLLRPLTRFKVMTSKSLAVFVLGCMVTLAMFVISLIVQIVSGNSLRSVPITFAAYLINMIPLIAIVSMALLINMISKSPTLAMLLCIVVYVFFKYLNYYINTCRTNGIYGIFTMAQNLDWQCASVYGTYIEDWNFVRLNLDFIHIIVYNI